VAGTPFMNDSAAHFNIPEARIVEAIDWVQSLSLKRDRTARLDGYRVTLDAGA
jgi:hypothetical protein